MADKFHLGPGSLAYARALGFDIQVGGHHSLTLSPQAYYDLFDRPDAEAENLYRGFIEHFGFGTLDTPLLIGLCSENLTTAARQLARYKPLVGPIGLQITQTSEAMKVAISWPDTPPVPALLMAIEALFWVALARKGPQTPQTPLSLALPVMPPAQRAFEDVAGVHVTLCDRQEITFSAQAARSPFTARRDDLVGVLEGSLSVITADRNFTASLRRALTAALPAGRVTAPAIASDLGISTRTLQRRLTEAGTSFRKELSTIRAALDLQFGGERNYSTADTAFLLGFQDVNSLYRARKLWNSEQGNGIFQ